jgi:HD-like signal output (HDOD) protein
MSAVDTWAMKSAREFIAELAEQISMPDVYNDIRKLIDHPDTEINQYVHLIENDSVLKIRLMRIANSPYFGFPRRAEGLYQAISLIGIMQLHDLVLNSLSFRTFAAIPQQIFNLEAFWKYSVQCGIAARTIAHYGQIIPINPFFTLGLMHEIGHAAMFVKAPELSLEAFDQANAEQGGLLIEKERDLLGFDYTQAGRVLMELWHLPEIYQQVTAYHLQPELADENHRLTLKIIHLAHMVCQDLTSAQNQPLIEQVKQTENQLQKLPGNINEIIIKEIEANTDNVLNMLWPNCTQELAVADEWQIHE